MTAIVLPDLNQQTIDDLRARVAKLSDVDLSKLDLNKLDLSKVDLSKLDTPSLQQVGKSADRAIDRLLGRSRSPIWPWVAAGIGLVAVVGAVSAWFAFFRRPTWTVTSTAVGAATEPVHSAENEGMTPRVPVETYRVDELVATRSNGALLEDI
jgi:hypothetical protein